MERSPLPDRDRWNAARWRPGSGHYESWFVRANHPTRPLALWIRYTIFSPASDPSAAEGELWAVWFDGESSRNTAAKSEHPIRDCHFDDSGLDVRVAESRLDDTGLTGSCERAGHTIAWDLSVAGGDMPLLLLPEASYSRPFPKSKTVVPRPNCRISGEMTVDGERVPIEGWPGSQNHNWGPAHTDRYAWGQVVGFDGHDDAFLECASARVRVGPLLTPWLTTAVLRLDGEELAFNSLRRAPFGHARVADSAWTFLTTNGRDRLRVSLRTEPGHVAELSYRNPPGGAKVCRNTKIAVCDLRYERAGQEPIRLHSEHRAAFEVLGLGGPSR